MVKKLVSLICMLLWLGGAQAKECVIKVGVSELKPHLSPNLDGGGPLAQSFSTAMAVMGCDTEFHWMPWVRAFQLTKKGKLTVTFPWGDSPQRRKDFVTSKPVWNSRLYLFHLKSTPITLNTLKDIKAYKVAGLKGYDYLPKNQDKFYGVIKVPTEDTLVNLLLKKRVDGILMWEVLLSNYPELTDSPSVTHSNYVLNSKAGLALFSKEDPNAKKYAEIFDAQFRQYLHDNLP